MKNGPIAAIGLATVLLACGDAKPKGDTAAVRVAAPDDTAAVSTRADSIDRYAKLHPESMTMFAKVGEHDSLVFVKDTASWPEETAVSYNIIVDSAGNVLRHTQAPSSQSGDWFETDTHYFDASGRTILRRFQISGFSSECTAILREHKDTFLTGTGAVIAERQYYEDGDGKPFDVTGKECYLRGGDAGAPKRSVTDLPVLKRP